MLFLDTETAGFTGPCLLIQYAWNKEEVRVHPVFDTPIKETLELIERMCRTRVIGFNLSYDWFHINKIYNILQRCQDKSHKPFVDEVAEIESSHPHDYAVIADSAVDVMIVARRGPYQGTMDRRPIRIKRVPTVIAQDLAEELTSRVEFPEIYFSKRKFGYQWDIEEDDEDFSNLILRFAASTSLDALAKEMLSESKAPWVINTPDLEQVAWRPYGGTWPEHIHYLLAQWDGQRARYYAARDVDLLRRLYYKLSSPETDNDSRLAMYVGAIRWAGYKVSTDLEGLREKYTQQSRIAPIAPQPVLRVLIEKAKGAEKLVVKSSRKDVLESLSKSSNEDIATFAKDVITARKASKRLEVINKLIQLNGKFFPDFKVMGTRTGRMSGGNTENESSSLNPQGIPREDEFRELFIMAYPGEQLDGGDFKSQEITIMDAVFKDPRLHEELKSGKKFHALMGQVWFGDTYEEILQNKEKYEKSKQGDFAWAYGAQDPKMASVLGKEESEVAESNQRLMDMFPNVAKRRAEYQDMFCAMSQPDGIGTQIHWKEPADYVENLFGFRRYFTLENQVMKALYDLASDPPKHFKTIPGRLTRRNRLQTIGGAMQSALFACAFSLQAANMRAASNMPIQATGGELTKRLQLSLQKQQPTGCHPWRIRTMNVHDEVHAVHKGVDTQSVVNQFLEKYRSVVPLLDIGWKTNCSSWKDIK